MIKPERLCPTWPQKPLGKVVEFLDHLRRPITDRDRVSGPYPYYGANGQQDSVADYIFDEPLILLAEDGGYFGDQDRTIAYRVDGKCWVNNHAHVLRPKDDVDIGFLCRHLEKYDVTRFINGATRQKLNKSRASEIPIALPSLSVQKRIAAILDKADDIRRKRQQAIKLADEFLRATFLDMFGDPVTNPKGWDVKSFSFVCSNYDSKRIPLKMSDRAKRNGPYPYYGASGIIDYIDEYIFDGKYLLIGEDGANLVARSTPIAFLATGKFWVNNHAHVVGYNGQAVLEFLEMFFSFIDLKPFISGSAQPKLTRRKLDSIPVPIPPMELQNKYIKTIDILNSLIITQIHSRNSTADLFNSLTQRAFRGEL